jgi:hypothetical protein
MELEEITIEQYKLDNRHKIDFGMILQRILSFPFFLCLTFIGAMFMWFKWMKNFVIYGGESIAYTEKMSRKTIQDVFMKLTAKEVR